MSFARLGWDGSDVYLFPTKDGFECCVCSLVTEPDRWWFNTPSAEAFLAHMHEHQAAGHVVPSYAFDALRNWIAQQAEPTTPIWPMP